MVRRMFGRAACLLLLTIFCEAGLQAGQAAVTVPPELIAVSNDVAHDARIVKAYLPVYPWNVVKDVDGWVTLGFVIDEIGFVQDIQVLAAQPQGVFDQAAINALARWNIQPASIASLPCGTTRQGAIVTFAFDHDKNPERLMPAETTLEILSLLNPAASLPASSKQTEYVVGSGGALDSDFEVLHRVAPRYPREAARNGISGVVAMTFEVTPDGKPADIYIIQSIPPGVFDLSAINALKGWRFKPDMKNGKVVIREACQRMVFKVLRHSAGWSSEELRRDFRHAFGRMSGGGVTAPPDW